MEEVWKDVQNLDGRYQVSNFGRVRTNWGKGKILKPQPRSTGYLSVALRNKKINYAIRMSIHRFVAMAFLPNPDNKPQVNHIDANKHNNHVDNLEWCTCSENIRHGYKMGLLKSPCYWKNKTGDMHPNSISVLQFDKNMKMINRFGSMAEAQRKTGIDRKSIERTAKHKQPVCSSGFHWEYELLFLKKNF